MSVATRALGGRPEVILRLGRGLVEAGREDQQLGLAVGVVVDGAERVAGDPHRRLRPRLEDVVVDLERHHARDHEVDLLLTRVAMPVAAPPTGPRQHPAPAEGDLLGRQCPRVPALLAVLGVVRHEVDRVLALRDGVRIGSAAGHRRPLAGSEEDPHRTRPWLQPPVGPHPSRSTSPCSGRHPSRTCVPSSQRSSERARYVFCSSATSRTPGASSTMTCVVVPRYTRSTTVPDSTTMPSSISSSSAIFSGRIESWTLVPLAHDGGTGAATSVPSGSRTPSPSTTPSSRFEIPMKPATNGRSGFS